MYVNFVWSPIDLHKYLPTNSDIHLIFYCLTMISLSSSVCSIFVFPIIFCSLVRGHTLLNKWITVYSLSVFGVHVASSLPAEGRLVTDLEIIESPSGVPIDFRYNESLMMPEDLISVPGCPKSVDGYPWVYYGKPRRCHLTGHKGPCPDGRILFMKKGSMNGFCSCECFPSSKFSSLKKSPDGRYIFCPLNQVHDTKRNMCYDLQEQGPCGLNQWLVKDRTGSSLTCVPACANDTANAWTWNYDYKKGMCTKMGTRIFGGPGNLVPNQCFFDDERFSFILKRCISRKPYDSLILG